MTKQCPRCEKHVEALANFCKHCGADIASFIRKIEKKCKTCKAFIDPLAKFCNFCGDDLEKLAHMGNLGLVILIALLTAIVVGGAFLIYGFTVKVPYTATIPYTILETYEENVPVVVERCTSESQFNHKADFRAQPNYLKNQGFGLLSLKFPDVVNKCKIGGYWITDNHLYLQPNQYCHEARGNIEGYADRFTQFTVNDAEAFDWRGIGQSNLFDPAAERFDGYAAYTYLCDIRGYDQKTHYARARVSGFGTKNLIINWEYFDDNTRPAVDFHIEFSCDLGSNLCNQVTENRVVEKQRAITKYKEETKYRFLIQEWFSR